MESSAVGNQVGAGYIHDGNARKGEITAPGEYELILISTPNPNRASNVPVSVKVRGQSKFVKVNQRIGNGSASLGRFSLPPGRESIVTVSNLGTDGFVVVDGLRVIRR